MIENITFIPTKRGLGYKLVLGPGKYLYCSKRALYAVIEGTQKSCQFREIQEEQEKLSEQ
jgi:hypothetical protein